MNDIHADLRAEYAELAALCRTLTPAQWRARSAFHGWTAWDEIAHLCFFDSTGLLAATDADAFAFDPAQSGTDYADLLRDVQNATLPSIALVNGVCMAGGIGLLCMTDLAAAADHALFGLPEVKVGLFPMQVLSLLKDTVPRRRLREWCLTGEPFGAAEAKAAGLLNHVVPVADLDATTQWLLDRLTGTSSTAIRRGQYALRALGAMSFDESLAYTEGQSALLAGTEDAKEGLAAFNEKRAPVWTGR